MALKAGIIGLGVGAHHITGFNSHPDCDVRVLCDFSKDKYERAKERYPELKVTLDSDEIIDDPELDIISIASYDNYHFDQVMKAIRNGKHVFVEKPLCLFQQEAIAIKKILAGNPHIRISSNLNLRTTPRFVRLREEILSGNMGTLFYVEADYLWSRAYKLIQGWRGRMDFYSIIYGAAVHMIDLVIWLTGMNPVEVQGYGNNISTVDSGFPFNDFSVILMKFRNNMIVKISANTGCVHNHFHKVTAYGTKKTFIHDVCGGKMITSQDPKDPIEHITDEYPGVAHKTKIITSFIDSILNPEITALVTDMDVFNTMSVCFAAERAVQEGKPVRIEYI